MKKKERKPAGLTDTIKIRCAPALKRQLEAEARRARRSMSDLFRIIAEDYLASVRLARKRLKQAAGQRRVPPVEGPAADELGDQLGVLLEEK